MMFETRERMVSVTNGIMAVNKKARNLGNVGLLEEKVSAA